MADITMCRNRDCPLKDMCYRFLATPDEYRQSYADFKPTDGECAEFWDIEERSGDIYNIKELKKFVPHKLQTKALNSKEHYVVWICGRDYKKREVNDEYI